MDLTKDNGGHSFVPIDAVTDPGFSIRGVEFKKFRPKPPILCNVTVGLHFTWNALNEYGN